MVMSVDDWFCIDEWFDWRPLVQGSLRPHIQRWPTPPLQQSGSQAPATTKIDIVAYCILLHIEYLMVRPWWSMERRGRQGWLNKTLQFPLRSRPRTCSPPRPRSPRALSQVSFHSYRTLSSLAVTPRLFLSIESRAEASHRRCTKAEIQVLCERQAKVNLAFEQFDSVTNTYRLSEMSAAMGGPDFLPPSRM